MKYSQSQLKLFLTHYEEIVCCFCVTFSIRSVLCSRSGIQLFFFSLRYTVTLCYLLLQKLLTCFLSLYSAGVVEGGTIFLIFYVVTSAG